MEAQQFENAIEIASSPAVDQSLRQQALEFVNKFQYEPSAWQICLGLFTKSPPPNEVARHYSLEILNNTIQAQRLDRESLGFIRENLMNYVRQRYGSGMGGDGSVDQPHMQNKLTQTLTYLFASLYGSGWETFFDDFRSLAGDGASIGTMNPAATIMYLRILGSTHDEIADVLVSRTEEEQRRNTQLKDLVRERDARKIAVSWQEILAKWRQTDLGIIEMCLKTVSRWVSWVDISLVVNEAMLNSLLQMAGQQMVGSPEAGEAKVRDAAIDTFTEIVAKKMKPADKIELLLFLNLGDVAGQLVASPALSETMGTSNYDTDLAETVAKLVNTVINDLVKVLESDSVDDQNRQRADQLLQIFVPYLLRFFADEYDEICSTVIPSLTDLLTYFRKLAKHKNAIPAHYDAMLGPILNSIINKMKYDDTASWGDEDEQTDEAEFQELRRKLHILQQTVAAINEALYIDTLSQVVVNTFTKLVNNDASFTWRDLELALHEMYLFGELAVKNQGLYQKKEPSSTASSRLIEMMCKMVESDIASFPHPAIQLQYMEICVRYYTFFEHNQGYIPRVLENFVRLTHHSHPRVRSRSWYLFLRFVRPLRVAVGSVSQTVIQAIGDLLTIKAELPDSSTDDDMSSDEEDTSSDAMFNSQLYLFEAIGCISSTSTVSSENKVLYAQSVMSPLFTDLEQNLGPAKNGDERAAYQIHHIIMALGTLARGFSDWLPATPGEPPTPEVAGEFIKTSEAILVALESLSSSMDIRTAARFAFSRLIGVLGSRLLQQLPRWIEGLLSQSSSKDEIALFLRVLDQVIFAFKTEISGILDSLLTPLLQRVFAALAEPVTGTDDEVQLKELRREYLNLILIVLNNDLSSVLVSNNNQPIFDTIISTIEVFARETADYPNARLAVGILVRMTSVWGGPDRTSLTDTSPTSPSLPGFDTFAITRFSPLTWSIPATPGFNSKDGMARQVLNEAAALQSEILKKTGGVYLERLREDLSGMGVSEQGIEEYLRTMTQAGEKGWKSFFVQFVGRTQ